MPANMRLIARTEAPSEETPPSTRPSSVASNSTSNSGPQRSTSMDSINTSSSLPERPSGEEVIPTRFTRSSPRVNVNVSMQFVKTKPAALYKSAKDQIQKAVEVKSLRKTSLQEEEEYQANLDKWKNTRRKRNEGILERVIESKKFEEGDISRGRRKSKTFNEMRQEKDKRGRRYNIVVHDDNDDLTELGLAPSAKNSIEEQPEEVGSKEVDNKDTKSDAGFCTGSDTGSDGVFAEDNISDTSSALGDKKEPIELLPDPSTVLKPEEVNGICDKSPVVLKSNESALKIEECTFDKAIEQYKQFTERSKKKSTSMSNIAQKVARDDSAKTNSQNKLQEKLGYFSGDLAREERIVPKMRSKNRDKLQKIDIKKRRSMFELRDTSDEGKLSQLKSPFDISESLGSKVCSFEKQQNEPKSQSVIPKRDINFKEKLAAFNQKNHCETTFSTKILDRDQNFYQKMTNYSKKQQSSVESKPILAQTTSLKQRIASFERSSPYRAKSISTECLSQVDDNSSMSTSNDDILKRSPSTPFLLVDAEEKIEVDAKKTDKLNLRNKPKVTNTNNRRTVYEQVEKSEIKRDTEAAPIYSIFNHNELQKPTDMSNGISDSPVSQLNGSSPLNDAYLPTSGGHPQGTASFSDHSPLSTFLPVQPSLRDFGAESSQPKSESFSALPLHSLNHDENEIDFDSLEARGEYGDDDIDEVIENYEQLNIFDVDGRNAEADCFPKESKLDDTNGYLPMGPHPMNENIYEQLEDPSSLENSTDHKLWDTTLSNDHTYQSLADKSFLDDSTSESLANNTLRTDHTYQSLEDLREEMRTITPPLPPKKSSVLSLQVLDVSWTEDSGRPNLAIPPSIPPPPPPIEDEDGLVVDGDMVVSEAEKPYNPCLSRDGIGVGLSSYPENAQTVSETDNKKMLMMKRSQFFGMTTPFVTEEISVKPPPDMKEFIRQERDSERQLIQSKTRSVQNDLDVNSSTRFKYTWEDRMKQDSSNDLDTSDTSSHLEFQCKLAELELEMEKHDRDMLQRINHSEEAPEYLNGIQFSPAEPVTVTPEQEAVPNSSQLLSHKKQASNTKSVPVQEFYSTPVSPTKSISSSSYVSMNKIPVLKDSALRKKTTSFIPPPNAQPPPKPSRVVSEGGAGGNQLNKPNIKALSAIPKPKRVDNDSWIVKKKGDPSKRNYNNHWLIQEAEQRRLDSLVRQSSAPVLPFRPANLLPAPISYSSLSPPQLSLSSQPVATASKPKIQSQKPINQFPSSNLYSSDNSNIYANTSNYSNPSSNSSSENINCKMKGVTYNPQKPSPPQKPLPASIISTITQRVSNKCRTSNNNDRPVMYNSRINNHDYMNSETLDGMRSPTDIAPIPLATNLINERHTTTATVRSSSQNATIAHLPAVSSPSIEEQRKLSVSGKKKCSHCCEELGRGAAMIIESLRLFYHIPCFKCCVCGTQLGNGTAGADVRVRNHKLHCHNCYSNDEGMKFSKV